MTKLLGVNYDISVLAAKYRNSCMYNHTKRRGATTVNSVKTRVKLKLCIRMSKILLCENNSVTLLLIK